MNRRFRTVALAAASLGLLLSLFIALRPGDEDALTPTTAQTTTEAPPATTVETAPGTTAQEPAPDLRIEIRGGLPVGGVQRATVERGPVSIRIVSDTAGELHVHGYDLSFEIAPSGTQEVEFDADTPGIFELELEGSHTVIAELEVRP